MMKSSMVSVGEAEFREFIATNRQHLKASSVGIVFPPVVCFYDTRHPKYCHKTLGYEAIAATKSIGEPAEFMLLKSLEAT